MHVTGASIIVEISVLRTSARKLVGSIIVLTAAAAHHFLTIIINVYEMRRDKRYVIKSIGDIII